MHVKLNVIKIFNRLSLLANQTTTSLPASLKITHAQFSNGNNTDTDCEKTDVANNNLSTRKFVMSSSLQLHEDDLSRIDVKSLVSNFVLFFVAQTWLKPSSNLLDDPRSHFGSVFCILFPNK